MFPPQVVLAAIDFSDAARVAVTYAARLAAQTDAALHVLHAEDPLLATTAAASGIDLDRETRDELAAFLKSALPGGGRLPVQHVVSGPAVDVICSIALRENADVIVVGAHGLSGAERRMFGSTTEGVLRNAERSILVVPSGWAPPRPGTLDLSGTGPVIAAIDLTAPSLAAFDVACRFAAVLGTSVEAVHVVPPIAVPARWMSHAGAAIAQRVDAARRELETAVRSVHSNVPITTRVESGPVAERLADTATTLGARALLVLGRRTRADRKGAPGATAYRVLTISQVPVLAQLSD